MGIGKVSSLAAASLSKVSSLAKLSIGKISSATASFAAAYSNSRSIAFDGTNDVILCDTATYDLGSWSMWLKYTDTLSVMMSAGGYYYVYNIFGNLRFSYRGGFDNILASSNSGNWLHLVVTIDRTGVLGEDNTTVKGYVNGVLQVTGTNTATQALGTQQLSFGAFPDLSYQIYSGNMDEVGWWDDKILTVDEVVAIYNSGEPIDLKTDAGDYSSSSDLTNYWRMGDGDTYPTIEDNKGSNDGTMTNMASGDIESDVPAP